MQSKQELEDWYSEPDRWGYFRNPDDENRLKYILDTLKVGKPKYDRALDIGCGEGFVTQHLPATIIHGYDVANNALNRLPQNVLPCPSPFGKYDLVITTGTLYSQYDHETINKMILQYAEKYVLVAGIREWLINYSYGKELTTIIFPYREFTQKLTLYELEARP
jgi:hypothetical protein